LGCFVIYSAQRHLSNWEPYPMTNTTTIIWILAGFTLCFLGGFALISLQEGEKRAARIMVIITLSLTGISVLAGFLPASFHYLILSFLAVLVILGLILFLLPAKQVERLRDVSSHRFDERDIMFSRARLQPGSVEYTSYYSMRPENEPIDNLFRTRPGLLSASAIYADPLIFALPHASFALTEAMHSMVDGDSTPEIAALPENPARTQLVKSLAQYFGALDVGVTRLKPEHIYSHIGRGSGIYGAPINLSHKYAIAITVEMNYGIMGSAPYAPVVMESAKQYVEAGRAAVQLAATIRGWGYPARAHMDGDYRVICPLVARDAGLGEIGRMGLLMTPRQGPRVRIAVVTTDLELTPDNDLPDASMIDFCQICGKCAENCPPKAISFDDRTEVDGALRWKIKSDLCFRYWTTIGTDCGRCMNVCPYSHPDSFYHNIVRWGNQRSRLFRHGALWMDNFLYGKQPEARVFKMSSSK
jgi:ferredoxin